MIYTLDAAAKKYQLDPVNIMELVFLGFINIYKVGNEYSFQIEDGDIEECTKKVGISKFEESFMHEIAEEYLSAHLTNTSCLDAIMTPDDFRGMRFLGSEIDAVTKKIKSITKFKETVKPTKSIERETKWNKCIEEALLEFEKDNGYMATTTQEVIQRLIHKAPMSYDVEDHENEGISIDSSTPTSRTNLSRIIKRRMGSK